jgi:putative membrane protein
MAPTSVRPLAWLLVAVIGFMHFGFMVAEMLLWPDTALTVAGFDNSLAKRVAVLGWNQGLYNGFLAAGLIWSLKWPRKVTTDTGYVRQWPLDRRLAKFFLACVLIAGVFGDLTMVFFTNDAPEKLNHILLILQALPALGALVALWLARRNGLSKMTT